MPLPNESADAHGVNGTAIDQGKVIEAGWMGFRMACYPTDVPEAQLREMRDIFFAGAQHLWSSILTFLDPEIAATATEVRRMESINGELESFARTLKR